jgi:hypothetical protein
MNLPRFELAEVNPRLGHEQVGNAFQAFGYDVLLCEYPQLHLFPTRGKDGAIDLSQTSNDSRVACECKHVGTDELATIQAEWRSVAKRLGEHLADPNGPTRGQSQYGPWYRKAPAIEKFVFCTSAQFKNQEHADHPQAGRVFSAWLRAAGEKDYIADALAHWFVQHRQSRGAMHVYRVWLRAGGSRAILHRGLIQWLEVHEGDLAMWRVLVRWLKSGGDTAIIRGFLITWARNNATERDADLVYRKWLAAGGDIPAVTAQSCYPT